MTSPYPTYEIVLARVTAFSQVEELEKRIRQLRPESEACHKSEFVSTMTLSLIQERYLKPWKYQKPEKTIDDYADKCLQLIYRAICVDEQMPCKNLNV